MATNIATNTSAQRALRMAMTALLLGDAPPATPAAAQQDNESDWVWTPGGWVCTIDPSRHRWSGRWLTCA